MSDFLSSLPASTGAPPEWDMILAASQKNKAEEVSCLLNEEGVPPGHGNIVGQTALHISALWGSVETMKVLLAAGADPNIQNRMKMTPLHCAIRGTFQSFRQTHPRRLKCVQLLLEAGANIELKDGKGKNVYESIDDAIQESKMRNMGDVEGEMMEMKQVMDKFGVGSGSSSVSALRQCIDNMDLSGLKECLTKSYEEEGDAVGNEEDNGKNGKGGVSQMEKNKALLAVVEKFKIFVEENNADKHAYETLRDMIHCLLEAHADPNSFQMPVTTPSPMEGAPLHIITSAICSSAITTNTTNSSETEAITDIATEMVQDLQSHGAKVPSVTMDLLPNAAHRGKTKVVKFLVQDVGIDPNYRGRQGMTALIFASRGGKIDIVKLLIMEKDKLDLNIVDDAGKKAIDYATANGKEEIVSLLLEQS